MHKCDNCKEVGNILTLRGKSHYWCGDCFSKFYEVQKGIMAEIQLDKIGS